MRKSAADMTCVYVQGEYSVLDSTPPKASQNHNLWISKNIKIIEEIVTLKGQ